MNKNSAFRNEIRSFTVTFLLLFKSIVFYNEFLFTIFMFFAGSLILLSLYQPAISNGCLFGKTEALV